MSPRIRRESWTQWTIRLGALLPLALLAWGWSQNALSADPIREATLRTGKVALLLLVLSLACSPAYHLSGLKSLLAARRSLGLYAFLYAGIHLAIFLWLDYGLDLELIREALFEKRYALAGLATFLLLVPLAITSTRGWRRRLGRHWRSLHRLSYLAAMLAVLHYLWSVKADQEQPLRYGALLLLLLALRLPPARKALSRWRGTTFAIHLW